MLHQSFPSAVDQADKAMLTLFEAAYFVAKEDLAFLKFEKLTDLLQRCKCPFLPQELYRNRDGYHELVSVMHLSMLCPTSGSWDWCGGAWGFVIFSVLPRIFIRLMGLVWQGGLERNYI